MNKNNQVLLLFTSSFPFGKGEQFIETEILFLAKAYKEVHIYPLDCTGYERPLPANAFVKKVALYKPYSRASMMLRRGIKLLSLYKQQLRLSRHPEEYKGKFGHHFRFLMHRVADAETLADQIRSYDVGTTVVYSYWFNVWTMVLLFGKTLGLHPFQVLTRAHGGDLDEAQNKAGYFAFRSTEIRLVDRVFAVSEYGRQLLASQYPQSAEKFSVSRLGVSDHGNNPHSESPVFRIVTCSFVYGLKRLHLVAEILSHLKFKVEWIHFGEGELLDDLKSRAAKLPAHVTSEFRGLVSNQEILNYYASAQVDLFMNVSELEGIPVSIMEAISFGIPVTGCRICGVPEIVTAETGFLLEKEFDVKEAAERISAYRDLSYHHKSEFRAGVKAFWSKNFNANANYPAFIAGLPDPAGYA